MIAVAILALLAPVALLALPVAARGGIVINQYKTTAHSNAWTGMAPDPYFLTQTLDNLSPASADVVGDWMGTNYGGSKLTWHWIGHGHMDTVTTLTADRLTTTGSGYFTNDL